MPHREGYPSPSTAESSDHEQPLCQPSPISSFDSQDASEKVEKELGRAIRRRTNRARTNRGTNRPPVRRLLEVVQARAHWGKLLNVGGGKGADWTEYEVTPSQYLSICDELELKSVRHDYDPVRSLLVLRMPTPIHEIFGRKLAYKITAWLEGLRSDRLPRAVQEIISNIVDGGQSDFKIPVPRDPDTGTAPCPKQRVDYNHSPDDQFLYIGSRDPPFTVEIGYSQQAKDLAGLAKQYYEGAAIKTVLTVDLEYMPKAKRKVRRQEESVQSNRRQTRSVSRQQKTSAASFSLYRGPKRVVFDRLFRDQAGNHVQNEGLTLYLSDFVPDAVLDTLPQKTLKPDPALHVPPMELFNFLVNGELLQKARDTTRTPSPIPQPREQKQKRKVEWALEEDANDDEDEDKHSDEQEAPASTRSRSASSKRRRLSDTAFSSSSRSSALPLMQTRSRSRGRQGPPSG